MEKGTIRKYAVKMGLEFSELAELLGYHPTYLSGLDNARLPISRQAAEHIHRMTDGGLDLSPYIRKKLKYKKLGEKKKDDKTNLSLTA